ncbi:AhpC/TSA family protein [Mucilaginibacter pallidiroseus]|uniref:AhpC/TSA family protein n=1 Tax=Mucilaginibacter pallidiroseus TaxID=2599295 RepID=A0A563TXE3_9SPHI|nr:TlpA disulfide reductase family protein [Mucilaginibacter pallidiroseus]TWR24025.1 AhpC/TSA family protein [Mucilaginibacter pallidiroseus]
MKKFLLSALALLPIMAFGQATNNFTLKGKVANLNAPAKAYLVYRLGANSITDSSAVTNGNFAFDGVVMFPVNASLFIDYKGIGFDKYIAQNFPDGSPSKTADMLNLYLEKGDINVTSADSVAKGVVSGSPTNTDNIKLKGQLKGVIEKAQKLAAEAKAATPAQQGSAAFQNAMQAKYKQIQDEQRNILKTFITNNPNSYLSLLALASVGGPSPDVAEVEPLYNGLSDEVKATEQAKILKNSIDNLKITAIGAQAPDFIQNDVNGVPVKLSSFRGKYVLIDFWASWCGPCRQENPNVVRNFNKYKGKNFTILGVSLDKESGKAAWLAAIKNDGLTWTQVSDLKYWNNMVAGLYGVQSIPQNFLIDPQGKIVAKNLRGDDLDAKLEQLLGKI